MTLHFSACLEDSFVNQPVTGPVTIIRKGESYPALNEHGCIHWVVDFDRVAAKTVEVVEIKPDDFSNGREIRFDLNTTGTDHDTILLNTY